MRIKSADDRRPQVAQLTALLSRPDVSEATRQRIELEIRTVKAGEQGETDAAYLIEFHYGRDPDVMTLHDLRIACDGRVAQVDHLIITRRFEFWVCESKRFSEGVEINEQGEWSAYRGGQRRGIASPIEQNKRHIAVLTDVFAKRLVTMPTRLGLRFKATLRSLVLVSDRTQITRPTGSTQVEGLGSVIKADQLKSTIDRFTAQRSSEERLQPNPATIVSAATVENVARQLAALHAPTRFAWAKRFGLPEQPSRAPERSEHSSGSLGRVVFPGVSGNRTGRGRSHCESCGDTVSDAVIEYCREYAALLEGSVLCVSCQDEFYPDR